MVVGEPKVSERARYSLAAVGVERSPAGVRQRTDASNTPLRHPICCERSTNHPQDHDLYAGSVPVSVFTPRVTLGPFRFLGQYF